MLLLTSNSKGYLRINRVTMGRVGCGLCVREGVGCARWNGYHCVSYFGLTVPRLCDLSVM